MSKQGWVIVTPEYQYNDEIYYIDGDGGQVSNTVFTDKAKADKAVGKLVEEFYRQNAGGEELRAFYYEIDEILQSGISCETASEKLKAVGIGFDYEDEDYPVLTLPKKPLTQVQIDTLSKCFSLSVPYLQEVTID